MTAFHGLGTTGDGAGVVTPLDHKLAQTGMVAKTGLNTIRPGLFWGGSATIVEGTDGMAYSVKAYTCVTSRGGTSGAVFGGNDGTLSVATTAAPVSNSRIDVVYHWHREFSLDGSDSEPVIGVIQGTAASSPTEPSLAAYPGAIKLATIVVPAGVTATNSGTTITQTAPFTTLDGGMVPFRNTTEMDSWTTALSGQEAIDLSTHSVYKWDGADWNLWDRPTTSWTPTLQNFNSLGSGGAATGTYSVSGGWCDFWIKVNFGSGVAAPSSSWGFTLPVPLRTALDDWNQKIGDGLLRDSSAGNSNAGGNADLSVIYNEDTGYAGFRQVYTGGSGAITSYGYLSATQSGIPTLASGDYITARGRFPV